MCKKYSFVISIEEVVMEKIGTKMSVINYQYREFMKEETISLLKGRSKESLAIREHPLMTSCDDIPEHGCI